MDRQVGVVEDPTTTYFVYPGLSVVYTKQGSTVKKNVYASRLLVGRVVGSTTSYYHQGALGSTRAVTDSAGAIAGATQYKPFGIEYGTTRSGASKLLAKMHDADK